MAIPSGEFIAVMRRCGWLSERELLRCIPLVYQANDGNKNAVIKSFAISTPVAKARLEHLDSQVLMNMTRRFGIDTKMRMTHFLPQIYQETGVYRWMQEELRAKSTKVDRTLEIPIQETASDSKGEG